VSRRLRGGYAPSGFAGAFLGNKVTAVVQDHPIGAGRAQSLT